MSGFPPPLGDCSYRWFGESVPWSCRLIHSAYVTIDACSIPTVYHPQGRYSLRFLLILFGAPLFEGLLNEIKEPPFVDSLQGEAITIFWGVGWRWVLWSSVLGTDTERRF